MNEENKTQIKKNFSNLFQNLQKKKKSGNYEYM